MIGCGQSHCALDQLPPCLPSMCHLDKYTWQFPSQFWSDHNQMCSDFKAHDLIPSEVIFNLDFDQSLESSPPENTAIISLDIQLVVQTFLSLLPEAAYRLFVEFLTIKSLGTINPEFPTLFGIRSNELGSYFFYWMPQ